MHQNSNLAFAIEKATARRKARLARESAQREARRLERCRVRFGNNKIHFFNSIPYIETPSVRIVAWVCSDGSIRPSEQETTEEEEGEEGELEAVTKMNTARNKYAGRNAPWCS